ncbi:twin-arginine translocase TatA/TatE family subunit [Vibrio sp. 10N.286.49.B3]|uniref:twin-arginine translocase TatA/TatE family subunit n=1 Tax=Vibrio sp. 10N.286.49.B3 TaxID=1880855 RepID=UPI000C83FEBA
MGVGVWQLLIIAVVILLLFGTKKLRSAGSDLGTMIHDFKKEVDIDTQPDNGK